MALTYPSDRTQIRPLHGALVRPYTVATALQIGDAVALNSSGDIVPARANADGTTNAIGVVVMGDAYMPTASLAVGATAAVVVDGPIAGLTGMTVTDPLFVSSATAGLMTQTAPTGGSNRVFSVGRPIGTNVFYVRPQSTAA